MKLTKNSYFNPQGKGVIRTPGGKLAVISRPIRFFWRFADGGEEGPVPEYTRYLGYKFPGNIPFGLKTYRLNTSDIFYTSRLFSGAPDMSVSGIQSSWFYMWVFGAPRSVEFWLFGKKITMTLNDEEQKVADYTFDPTDGSVWINGEYRGKWNR